MPLDADFWNRDRTRFTVFFDPGRQKRGIMPNEEMGRSLVDGRSYTLVVSREWRDAQGLPLKEEFRRRFKVGPPDERPLNQHTWRIDPPRAGTRDPLAVAFPEPLDRGLLQRALTIADSRGRRIEGTSAVEAHETHWLFTPAAAWRNGDYFLQALTRSTSSRARTSPRSRRSSRSNFTSSERGECGGRRFSTEPQRHGDNTEKISSATSVLISVRLRDFVSSC